ncbi:MAG: hypothetical protein E4H20_05030 [Spirochaetales bacterium]|nr:MAG: hypothetical protein E4H20_05030 [Spirochaetales bacterium]
MSAAADRRGGDRRNGILAVALLVLAIAAIIVIPMVLNENSRPVILALDPPIGDPGGSLRIIGRNFGSERGDGRIEFDDAPPTVSSYLMWSDTLIEVRVPLYAESNLVRVLADGRRSNPRMFMSSARLPRRPSGVGSTIIGPTIDSLSVDQGSIGSVLVVKGLNFSANRDNSSVQFSWQSAAASFASQEDTTNRGTVAPSENDGEYVFWSDKEIRMIVPDGAVSGSVAVSTDRGVSPARYFQVGESPGTKAYTDKRTYALNSFVTISRVQSSGPNSLHLWIPFPAVSASQRGVKVLGRSYEPLVAEYRGLSVYRLSDLTTGKLVTVSQDHLVQVYAVETEIKEEKIKAPPNPAPPLYAIYTAASPFVPADSPIIRSFAAKATGKEKNPYRMAKLLYGALMAAVRYAPAARSTTIVDALGSGSADAWDIALLYTALLRVSGVPARPVAGVVVDDTRRAWNHVWVEFYLYGFGWVPVDAVLASGGVVQDFQPVFEDRSRYFGNMDARHIAFSAGAVRVDPLNPDGRTVRADRRYSMQTISEEASGLLDSYTSFWSDVEVTGVY